ncbi:MAG TPA: adenine deaminase [Deltaproteobacteria bacterium]|jgi:adenine deaminase|nr:adenine deaminase [Deltaproteobacteria bacterium]HOI05725.1 adenine deaminase [Deltaproteobacteria bacterium]
MTGDAPPILSGNVVDLPNARIFPATLHIRGGRIARVVPDRGPYDTFITPGLVDAHIHIESSMLTPYQFAREAVTHGTLAAVCDPHEIANVLGVGGVEYMRADAGSSPFVFAFGAPSCVPATPFETSGALIGAGEVARLLERSDVSHLSEVMNFPAVIARDPEVMAKIDCARRLGKPIDGHAPGLRGEDLRRYVSAGISTDHEATNLEEALEKIEAGMKILIREGSAARDFDSLNALMGIRPDRCMLCSDDLHPDDLVGGHIDRLVRRALASGLGPLDVLRCATLNPVLHYRLPLGLLREGDPADLLVVDSLEEFRVLKAFLRGRLVSQEGQALLERKASEKVNIFRATPKKTGDFALRSTGGPGLVIEARDGSLLTGRSLETPKTRGGLTVSDPDRDILKLAVVNRYRDAPPATALVRGFGLKKGAIASTVAHDSHNVIVAGVSDEDICAAVNAVIESRGGLAVVSNGVREVMALPVAGLMTDTGARKAAALFSRLQGRVRELGSAMQAPFITLSFMALLVIPSLKLSDQGLFDGETFTFIK